MTEPALLTATLRSPDGWPVPDATLTVLDGTGRQAGSVLSDDAGHARVHVATAGAVTVVLAAAGSEPLARTVRLAPGGHADLGVVVLAGTGSATLPAAGTWTLDAEHSSARARARHLGLATVHGRFTRMSGEVVVGSSPQDVAVHVVLEAASITTDNDARDEHLRSADFLDVARHPTLEFRAAAVRWRSAEHACLPGLLTLRDVTREVELDLTYLGSGPDPWGGTRAAFTATTQLARRDWAMTWNMGLPGGLTVVGPTLQVELDVELVRQDG